MTTLKDVINQAPPNSLADALRAVGFGDMLRNQKTTLRRKLPAASAAQLATLVAITLPNDAKAETILRVQTLAGAAGVGEQAIVLYGATPTTGQVAVAPNGDIVFLASDAPTIVDVVYEPAKQDLFTYTGSVVAGTGVMALPSAVTGKVVSVIAAVLNVGTVTGTGIVIVPSNTVPATTKQVNLNLAKSQVQFRIADAVTNATVILGVTSAIDADALLEADPGGII